MPRALRWTTFLLLATFMLAGCAGVTGAPTQRTITVSGTGVSHLAPDIAIVTLGVQTQGPDVGQAVQENNQAAQAVMEALKQAGVAAEDTRTTNFFVSNQPVYDTTGSPTGATNYIVDNTVTFTLRQPDKLGAVLQAALNKGANSVQNVAYSVDDPSKALDDARQKAIQDAQKQAELLAGAAGAKLGKVIGLSEGGVIPQPYAAAPAFGKGGGGGAGAQVSVSPGTLDYEIDVTVTYVLQ